MKRLFLEVIIATAPAGGASLQISDASDDDDANGDANALRWCPPWKPAAPPRPRQDWPATPPGRARLERPKQAIRRLQPVPKVSSRSCSSPLESSGVTPAARLSYSNPPQRRSKLGQRREREKKPAPGIVMPLRRSGSPPSRHFAGHVPMAREGRQGPHFALARAMPSSISR